MIGGFLFLGGMKMDGVVRWFESVEVRECGGSRVWEIRG